MFARTIVKYLVRLVADLGLVGPFAAVCAYKTRRVTAGLVDEDAVRILALSSERFIADLRALEATGGFEVYAFPQYWQYAGLALHSLSDGRRQDRFLERFFRAYRHRIAFDMVVGTSLWYKQDIPWGSAAQRSGTPYVVLHKECFKPEPLQAQAAVQKALKFGPFMGERLLVHNEPIAAAFIASNYVSRRQVEVCGIMRMDDFVKRAQSSDASIALRRKRPLVTYFSFALGLGLDDRGVDPFPKNPQLGWYDLFCESHLEFAKLALRRPDIDFVIKTKWSGQWTGLINDTLRREGIEPDSVSNLTIQSTGNAHNLIFESLVVCSFSSTTVLEAALAGKPVVIPHFGEVGKEGYLGRVKLLANYNLFDVACSPNEFGQLIEERLYKPDIVSNIHDERLKLFERWVSLVDGSALFRYVAALNDTARRGVSSRSHSL